MDKKQVLKTKFEAKNLTGMAKQANQIAHDLGLENAQEKDAFRHAYTAAKITESGGAFKSSLLEWGVELASGVLLNNNLTSAGIDLTNNKHGREINKKLDEHQLLDEEREYALRLLVYTAVKDGSLLQEGDDARLENFFPHEKELQNNAIERGQKLFEGASPQGEVDVKRHERDGHNVRAHTRSWPD